MTVNLNAVNACEYSCLQTACQVAWFFVFGRTRCIVAACLHNINNVYCLSSYLSVYHCIYLSCGRPNYPHCVS